MHCKDSLRLAIRVFSVQSMVLLLLLLWLLAAVAFALISILAILVVLNKREMALAHAFDTVFTRFRFCIPIAVTYWGEGRIN